MAANPWEDRQYLLGLLQRSNPHDPLRQTAEKQWELLNQREAQAASLGATRENLAETIRSREAGQTEATKQREERAKETAGYREDILAQRAEAAKNSEAARVLSALQYETDPNVTKQVLAQFYGQHGVTAPTAAPDPALEAAKRARATSGQPVVAGAQPTAAAPPTAVAGAPAPATGAPTTAAAPPQPPVPAAPFKYGTQAYDYGPTTAAQPTFKEQVPGGLLRTHLPSGGTATAADPSTPEGLAMINAARQESSRLQGIPFSPATLAAKPAVAAPAVAAGAPIGPPTVPGPPKAPGLNERLGATGEALSKYTDPLGTAIRAASAGISAGARGVGNLFGGGGADQIVQGPTPEPTPQGTPPPGPFTGIYTAGAPQPTPVVPAGTPAAIPAPQQITDEELRKRLATQTQNQ